AAGTIRLAFTSSVPMREAFARMLRTFRGLYPEVQIELQHMGTGSQFAALDHDQIDFGILRPPLGLRQRRDSQRMPLWRDRSRVFFPSSLPLANSSVPIEMAELVDQ